MKKLDKCNVASQDHVPLLCGLSQYIVYFCSLSEWLSKPQSEHIYRAPDRKESEQTAAMSFSRPLNQSLLCHCEHVIPHSIRLMPRMNTKQFESPKNDGISVIRCER